MKKLYLLTILFGVNFVLYGQHDIDDQGILFTTNNKLGVGTNAPETILHIKQSTRHQGLTITEEGNLEAIKLHLAQFDDGRQYGYFMLGKETMLRGNGEKSYFKGSLGIGTTNPDAKLAVKGNIHAQEVKVDLNGSVAPDYVFKEDYDLRSLESVKAIIQEKGHLPNIPSAKEMEENGINLKEMNLKLLEKIEELTLYVINQNERIKKLEQQNKKLMEAVDIFLAKKSISE